MVFQAVVHNGMIKLPPEAHLPDGTPVRIEPAAPTRFSDLLDLAGTWDGDDADRIVKEIYDLRSSSPARATLDT